MGTLDGRVAFVTGVARGQGRSHAVKLAGEGADIIGIDALADEPTVHYPLATPAELEETAEQIEGLGRRAVPDRTRRSGRRGLPGQEVEGDLLEEELRVRYVGLITS